MAEVVIDGGMVPRHYQIPYMSAMDGGCKFACWVMHRRGGKDRTALAQACKDAFKRTGLYWHCLPTLKQGRKVVWDNITSEGKNLIEQTFPRPLVARKLEDDMKIELVNGSIVQIVGADNFNSLVGASPVHVTFSEWSLTDPRAYDFVRPILRENNGSVAFIYTPRGYNHAHKTLLIAQRLPGAFSAVMSIRDTGVLSEADMQMERAQDMPEELIQQEYYCDFSSANVGAIVGRYISEADRSGRISTDIEYEPGNKIFVSSDLGMRDAAAWWFWQIKTGHLELIHYEESTGLEAAEWIDRLKGVGLPIDHVYLPHDAKTKTMATRFTVIEQFAQAFHCARRLLACSRPTRTRSRTRSSATRRWDGSRTARGDARQGSRRTTRRSSMVSAWPARASSGGPSPSTSDAVSASSVVMVTSGVPMATRCHRPALRRTMTTPVTISGS